MTRGAGLLGIRTAGSRRDAGLGGRLSTREEVDENPYAIRDLHPPVIVGIGGIQTVDGGVPQEEEEEHCDSIGQVYEAIVVGVSPVEYGSEKTLVGNPVSIRIEGSAGADVTLIREPVFITVAALSPPSDISIIPDPVSIAVIAGEMAGSTWRSRQ